MLKMSTNKFQEQNIILREYVQLLRRRVTEMTFSVHKESSEHDAGHAKLCSHETCETTRNVLGFTHDYNSLEE